MKHKRKIDKLELIKMTYFCYLKDPIKKDEKSLLS